MRRLFAKLLVVVSLAVLSPALAAEGNTSGPEQLVNRFTRALLASDTQAVQSMISKELLQRILNRAQGATYEEQMLFFIDRESSKLNQTAGGRGSLFAEGFTVTAMEEQSNGAVLALHLGFAGQSLPKPFYLVLENGEYKINMARPATGDYSLSGTSVYVVKNDDFEQRTFNCERRGSVSVAPTQTVSADCPDTCGLWDGTRFYTSNGAADCDWNQFGVDMSIRNNVPICTTRC
jgi:hypothetical protein